MDNLKSLHCLHVRDERNDAGALRTYATANSTRSAQFQENGLVCSIIQRYLCDPHMQRNIRRSQYRIESYHKLRAGVANIVGKKKLNVRQGIETESVINADGCSQT